MATDRPEQAKQLPATAYAVLGLLTWGAMSGYDVMRAAHKGIAFFFWRPAKSQIYTELRRLKSRGYVTEREVEQDRRPDKRVYTITSEGEQALRAWLTAPDQTLEPGRLLLKIYFGHLMPAAALVELIEEYRRMEQENLARFENLQQRIANREETFFRYLTLLAGLAHARAGITWADKVLALLAEHMNTGEGEQHVPDTR